MKFGLKRIIQSLILMETKLMYLEVYAINKKKNQKSKHLRS